MKTRKPKTVFEHKVKCPHCKKLSTVKQMKTMVKPAEPAEYEFKTVVEKSAQMTLVQASKKKRAKSGKKGASPPKIKGGKLTKEQKEYLEGKQKYGADAIDQDAQIRTIKA